VTVEVDVIADKSKEELMKINVRTGKPFDNGTIPTTIWEGNLTTNSSEAKESNFHPTVKPQFVLQRMIYAYTKEGDTVLDCLVVADLLQLLVCKREENLLVVR
tara:strand:- start:1295 stop:1603 length:309 start_codon:yes stop_codon:yes gene_type:complete